MIVVYKTSWNVSRCQAFIQLGIYKNKYNFNKFPDFFRMGTFIDSTHMKLSSPLK